MSSSQRSSQQSSQQSIQILPPPPIDDTEAPSAPTGLTAELASDTSAQLSWAAYFEALGAAINRDWAPLRGVLRSGRKFIQLPLPELYHLEDDPAEEQRQLALLPGRDRRRTGPAR